MVVLGNFDCFIIIENGAGGYIGKSLTILGETNSKPKTKQ